MSLVKTIPGYLTPRDEQLRIIEEIVTAYARGFQTVLLQAPTGSGKSLIGRYVAGEFASSYLMTPLTSLQDQYWRDLKAQSCVTLFKGKSRYRCSVYDEDGGKLDTYDPIDWFNIKREQEEFWDATHPESKHLSLVASAACQSGMKSRLKRCKEANRCAYYRAQAEAANSQITILNFMSYIVWEHLSSCMDNPPFLPRELHVVDEAHKIEDTVKGYLAIELSEKRILKLFPACRDDLRIEKGWREEDVLSYLKDVHQLNQDALVKFKYKFGAADLEDLYLLAEEEEDVKKVVRPHLELQVKMENLLKRYENDQGDYGMGTYYDAKMKCFGIVAKPTNVGYYVKEHLLGGKNLFMSATLPMTEVFAKEIGLDNFKVINMESSFPAKNRRIFFRTVGRMNKDTVDGLVPAACEKIKSVLAHYPGYKGIIHTPSYKITKQIGEYMGDDPRYLICESDTTADLMRQHVESEEPTILVSPAMKEGVDLKGDLSRVQFIFKCPYDSLEDPSIKAKMKVNPMWYQMRALTSFMQMYGRSIRDPEDWAYTIILDDALVEFIQRHRRSVPNYILEAMVDLR